jgi:hypothetical protein
MVCKHEPRVTLADRQSGVWVWLTHPAAWGGLGVVSRLQVGDGGRVDGEGLVHDAGEALSRLDLLLHREPTLDRLLLGRLEAPVVQVCTG